MNCTHLKILSVALAFWFASASAFAAKRTTPVNLYVSEGGTWNPEGGEYAYSTIAAAVAAATVDGDTVWVKDGFVCSDVSTSSATMISSSKSITLRSESGYVDETAGKGATIRGPGYKTTETANFKRTLSLTGASAKLIGFILEDGCVLGSGFSGERYGGCLSLAGGVVSNCVIRGGYGRYGAGISGSGTLYNTVLTNNFATNDGGGTHGAFNCYNCDFLGNTANGGAGGGYAMQTKKGNHPTISNCIFRANIACMIGVYSGGGGLATNIKAGDSDDTADVIECRFEKNVSTYFGGGARGSNYYRDCVFSENISSNSSASCCMGGGVFGFDGRSNAERDSVKPYCPSKKPAVLNHCTVVSNSTLYGSGGPGGGIAFCVASNGTRIAYNAAASGGAGANLSALTDCEIVGNLTTNLATVSSWALGGGAGINSCSATNCLVANNVLLPMGTSNTSAYGGGAENCNLVNCVISNNISRSGGGGVSMGAWCACYNNVIVDNLTYGRGGGLWGPKAAAYNCLIARNEEKEGGSVGGGGACGEWVGNESNWQHLKLVNCTVAENVSEKSPGGVNIVDLVNTIAYGNTGGNGKNGTICSATNCCYDAASGIRSGDGNITDNPKLIAEDSRRYQPKATSPCRGKGYYAKDDPSVAWMADEADPRSKSLNGLSWLATGKPSIGAFAYSPVGLMLLVR